MDKNYFTECPSEGVWKFVKVDGQLRFSSNHFNYCEMIMVGEVATDAGLILVESDLWRLVDCSDKPMIRVGVEVIGELTSCLGVPLYREVPVGSGY